MTIRSSVVALATASTVLFMAANAQAQSIGEALAMAYSNNPSLNAARSQLRGIDENVAQALSGWRPQIFANLSGSHTSYSFKPGTSGGPGGELYYNTASVGVQIQQSIFRGFRTVNSTKQAESLVKAQRASLTSSEQSVLLSAAQAYMNVIRDTAIVALNRSNIKFLGEQVRAAKDRFEVGEGTRTDIAQADARLAGAQSQLNLALANLNADRAVFRQVVGVEPGRIVPKTNIRAMLPPDLKSALQIGASGHPDIIAAQYNIDAADFNVKVVEGNMLPTVTVEGNVQRSWNPSTTTSYEYADSASVVGRVSVPLYQGGLVSSQVRQAKEELGTRPHPPRLRPRQRARLDRGGMGNISGRGSVGGSRSFAGIRYRARPQWRHRGTACGPADDPGRVERPERTDRCQVVACDGPARQRRCRLCAGVRRRSADGRRSQPESHCLQAERALRGRSGTSGSACARQMGADGSLNASGRAGIWPCIPESAQRRPVIRRRLMAAVAWLTGGKSQ